jgi:hypothetical protein
MPRVTEETKQYIKETRTKIILAKASVPFKNIALKFCEEHPEYDNADSMSKASNMVRGLSLGDREMVNKFLEWCKKNENV